MAENKPTSLRQIAEIAGVSVATVSRVIHKNGRFSKETEERVQRVIDQYQYSPDITAQSMRTKRIPAVGILYPDLANQHLAEYVVQLEEQLFDLGYATFICGTRGRSGREEAYIKLLLQHKVSGMIFLYGAFEDHRQLIGNLPKVYIGRTPTYLQQLDDRTVVIETNHEESGYIATKHLLDRGCHNILFPTRRPLITNMLQGREVGFTRALREHGIEDAQPYVKVVDTLNEQGGYNSTKQWLQEGVKFDGICAANDRFAIGCMRALIEAKVDIPGQVRVIGHDDMLFASYNVMPLSSIRDPQEAICSKAIDSLVAMMDGEKPQCNRFVLQGSVIQRETT